MRKSVILEAFTRRVVCVSAQNFFITVKYHKKVDGSLPANPVNDRRVANAVTLKSTFCLP